MPVVVAAVVPVLSPWRPAPGVVAAVRAAMAVARRTRCLDRSGYGARRRGGGEAFNHWLVVFVLGLFLGSSCGGVLGRPELDHVATLVR